MKQCPPVAKGTHDKHRNGAKFSLWRIDRRPAPEKMYALRHVYAVWVNEHGDRCVWDFELVCDFWIADLLICLLIYNVTSSVNLAASHL